MARRYIDADELLNGIYSDNPQDLMKYIAEFPTSDVRENVRGAWELHGNDDDILHPQLGQKFHILFFIHSPFSYPA